MGDITKTLLTEGYTRQVMKHFKKPHNFGSIKNADGVGIVGNVVCGDIMKLYLKIKEKDDKRVIKDVKFETFGCIAAIATSSMITDLIKGKTIDYALRLTKDNIIRGLGGLPAVKIHCSVLAVDALREAIYDYYKKKGMNVSGWLEAEHKAIMARSKERHAH